MIIDYTINAGGRPFILDTPKIMGILNLTPDSFYDGGSYNDVNAALTQVQKMVLEGVDILDLGAASSRPGAGILDPQEEIDRLIPILKEVRTQFPDIIISIDTYHRDVAEMAVGHGASIINDISAFSIDPSLEDFVIEAQLPYVLMHMQGSPGTMQKAPAYKDVSGEILQFFLEKIHHLEARGVRDIIIDPGFGFGKSIDHNYELLSRLEIFKLTGRPILCGISRKSMIYKLLDIDAKDALPATTALHLECLKKGANILRVHDVKEAAQVIKLWQQLGK